MARTARWFGESAGSRGARLPMLLIVVAAVVVMGTLPAGWIKDRRAALAESDGVKQGWSMAGPACPRISRAGFLARGLVVNKGVEVGEVTLERRFGAVSCFVLASGLFGDKDYAVCQFTGPEVLRITTERTEAYFVTPIGRPAAVSMQDGVARCTLATNPPFKVDKANPRYFSSVEAQ
jgi:hypothetical protein